MRTKQKPPRIDRFLDWLDTRPWAVSLLSVVFAAVLVVPPAYIIYVLTKSHRSAFSLNGHKVTCDSEQTACGMRLSNCDDAPNIVLHCVTDLPEVKQ